MNKLKLVVIGVIAATVSLVGVIPAGATSAHQKSQFLKFTYKEQPGLKGSSQKMEVGLGKGICTMFKDGATITQVSDIWTPSLDKGNSHLTQKEYLAVVVGAARYLCPSQWTQVQAQISALSTPKPAPAPKVTVPTAPPMTQQQQNAVQDANSYLSAEPGFSQQGLINQLSGPGGDGFSVADATAAVDSLTVDWNAQAVDDANNYNSTVGGFSCSGLVQQLEFDQFTAAQATYGATQAGDC